MDGSFVDKEPTPKKLCFICYRGQERSPRLVSAFKDAGCKTAWYFAGGMKQMEETPDDELKAKLSNSFVYLIKGGRSPRYGRRINKTSKRLKKLGIDHTEASVQDLSIMVREISNGRVEPRDHGLI